MKNLRLTFTFTLILVQIIGIIYSCKKSSDDNLPESEFKKLISQKWMINNTKSSSSEKYLWFEFFLDSTYIIKKADGKSISGKNNTNVETKTLILSDFGHITINTLSDKKLSFHLKLNDFSNNTEMSATSASIIDNSNQTDLLCKKWRIDKIVYKNTLGSYDSVEFPHIPAINDFLLVKSSEVIFSKYGTYFVTNEYEDSLQYINNNPWRWNNNSETEIYIDEYTIFSITELSDTLFRMKYIDNKADYWLRPK
jgi:hypothetical protein